MNNDQSKFGELFQERGLSGYDKGEKQFGDPNRQKEVNKERKEIPSAFQDSLDLHGKTLAETPEIVESYINKMREIGYMFVLIAFGLGRHSPDGQGKLRPVVIKKLIELENNQRIRRFRTAEPRDGGYGAVYVYLR
jgi:DNA-nicking Smr family endonuclease